tara:strand:- start:228 stop:2399 length:2172 start_codon:yes stop_codon:yes gene_type:complete
MKLTKQKLKKIIKEELVGLRHRPDRLDEGLFDFFAGLFNSILALFGVEIQKASDDTRKTVVTYANQALAQQGIKDKDGKPVKYGDLDPDNPDHAGALKVIAPAMVEDALKGVRGDLEAMKDVPPLPDPPADDADDAAKDQYKADEAKMKKGAEGLGKLLGATEALGVHYPEFKQVADQVKKNKPTAPADIFYQAGVLAKAFEDAKVFKEHFQRYEGLDKLHEHHFFHHMTLGEALYGDRNRVNEGLWDTIVDALGMGKDEKEVEEIESDVEKAEQKAEATPMGPLKLREKVQEAAITKPSATKAMVKRWLGAPTEKAGLKGMEGKITNGQLAAVVLLHIKDTEAEKLVEDLSNQEMRELTNAAQTLSRLSEDDVDEILTVYVEEADDAKTDEEIKQETDILSIADAVEALSIDYLNGHPETKQFAALSNPSELPSTEAEGEMGEAAREAQKGGEEEVEFDIPNIIKLGGEDTELLANVFVMMPDDKAAELLTTLDPKIAAGVVNQAVRITSLDPDIIALVGEELEVTLPAAEGPQAVKGEDVMKAAIKKMKKKATPIAKSGGLDKELQTWFAENVRGSLFQFDQIPDLDASDIKLLLKEVDRDTLIMALKGLKKDGEDKDVYDTIIGSLSDRAAEMIQDDMEAKGPVPLSGVEAAQAEVIQAALRLNSTGAITIPEGKKGGKRLIHRQRLGDLLFENRKPRKRTQRSNTILARWGQLAGLDKD